MKSILRIPILLLAAVMILLLAGCVPFPMVATSDGLVVGQSYRLKSGDSLDNDLTVIGGSATLEEDSTVNGSLAVIGGTVTVDGTINGDLSVIGGDVSLGESAVVQGSVDTVGGTLRRADGATINGKRVDNNNPIPRVTTLRTPPLNLSFDPITGPLTAMFQALALAALAVVVTLFAPVHMERTARTAFTVPAASGGVGCLTLLVLVVMTVTIILIPVSFLGVLVAMIAALFGWLAIGLLIGRRIGILLKQSWTEPVNAGVGTLLITLLASIPCIGALGWIFGGLVALGAVVLTRFGTQVYPSPYSVAPVPQPGPYAHPPAPAPVQEVILSEEPEAPSTGARVYPVESDQPGENAPDENKNA